MTLLVRFCVVYCKMIKYKMPKGEKRTVQGWKSQKDKSYPKLPARSV